MPVQGDVHVYTMTFVAATGFHLVDMHMSYQKILLEEVKTHYSKQKSLNTKVGADAYFRSNEHPKFECGMGNLC